MHSKYHHLQDFFPFIRESHIKPGAYRLQRLLGKEYFHTSNTIPSILIGGTNGKGTTCAFVESILRHSGLKTGLYTSPHLINPTERIRISGVPVSEKEILDTICKLDINKNLFLPDATFFEYMTAAALLLFREKKVDVIIFEVGLGGRYDSTNIINPIVSVLTGVSLEHTQFLGNTVFKIAQDKAYIARRNKPFIVNANVPPQALKGASKTSKIIGCHMILTSEKFNKYLESISLHYKDHPAHINLRTALSVIHCIQNYYKDLPNFSFITSHTIRQGIRRMFWPGRFDVRKINNKIVIFDCAHNPGGIKFFLRQYLKSKFSSYKFNLIFSTLKDKNWKENIKLLSQYADLIEIVPFANERAENAHDIFNYIKSTYPNLNTHLGTQINESLQKLINHTSNTPLLVTGSIAFVGAVFESLQINVFPT